jgi:hypothetical protein
MRSHEPFTCHLGRQRFPQHQTDAGLALLLEDFLCLQEPRSSVQGKGDDDDLA